MKFNLLKFLLQIFFFFLKIIRFFLKGPKLIKTSLVLYLSFVGHRVINNGRSLQLLFYQIFDSIKVFQILPSYFKNVLSWLPDFTFLKTFMSMSKNQKEFKATTTILDVNNIEINNRNNIPRDVFLIGVLNWAIILYRRYLLLQLFLGIFCFLIVVNIFIFLLNYILLQLSFYGSLMLTYLEFVTLFPIFFVLFIKYLFWRFKIFYQGLKVAFFRPDFINDKIRLHSRKVAFNFRYLDTWFTKNDISTLRSDFYIYVVLIFIFFYFCFFCFSYLKVSLIAKLFFFIISKWFMLCCCFLGFYIIYRIFLFKFINNGVNKKYLNEKLVNSKTIFSEKKFYPSIGFLYPFFISKYYKLIYEIDFFSYLTKIFSFNFVIFMKILEKVSVNLNVSNSIKDLFLLNKEFFYKFYKLHFSFFGDEMIFYNDSYNSVLNKLVDLKLLIFNIKQRIFFNIKKIILDFNLFSIFYYSKVFFLSLLSVFLIFRLFWCYFKLVYLYSFFFF